MVNWSLDNLFYIYIFGSFAIGIILLIVGTVKMIQCTKTGRDTKKAIELMTAGTCLMIALPLILFMAHWGSTR